MSRAELGRFGEDLAARRYEAQGATVLARNWRCRLGELDLVVLEPDGTVVFCEVKTRSDIAFGEPQEAVGPRKARRVRALACQWLQESRPGGSRELRFDVVAVLRRRGAEPRVVHLRSAF